MSECTWHMMYKTSDLDKQAVKLPCYPLVISGHVFPINCIREHGVNESFAKRFHGYNLVPTFYRLDIRLSVVDMSIGYLAYSPLTSTSEIDFLMVVQAPPPNHSHWQKIGFFSANIECGNPDDEGDWKKFLQSLGPVQEMSFI